MSISLSALPSSNPLRKELEHGQFLREDEEFKNLNHEKGLSRREIRRHMKFLKKRSRQYSPPWTKCKSKSETSIKNTSYHRSKLSHKEYLKILSAPHLHDYGDHARKKKPKKTRRVMKSHIRMLALPTKRRILNVWSQFAYILSPEIIRRLHDLYYYDPRHDMKQLRYFSKLEKLSKLDHSRHKTKKNKKKKKLDFFKNEANITTEAILSYFSGNIPLTLNIRQEFISETLLRFISDILKEPIKKKTNDLYHQSLIETVDKMAMWIDRICQIVDMGDFEKIGQGMKELPSIDQLGEEEETEELVEEEEGEYTDEIEEEEDLEVVSSLERLIQILARASSDYLNSKVDNFEDLTRNELLNKIKILNKDYTGSDTPAQLLKFVLLDWALRNDPDNVDDHIIKKIELVSELLSAMLSAEDVYGMLGMLPDITESKERPPGPEMRSLIQDSLAVESVDKSSLVPGTVAESVAPDGSIHKSIVSENGELIPVNVTPSGNIVPVVYDRNGKVVDKLFDDESNLLDVKFNKLGVPEPETYNGALFDDVNDPHELIHNRKGRIIPQCYDKDGNPIPAEYDEDGNPIYFGPDGNPITVPPGGYVRIIDGKLVIFGPDGKVIEPEETEEEVEEEETVEEDETEEEFVAGEEDESELEVPSYQADSTELEVGGEEDEEEEEETVEEDIEETTESPTPSVTETEVEKEITPTGSRESMIKVIKGHKPRKIREHSNDTVCCLSIKIWAVWLLEITHNAHNWTKWITNIVMKIREFAAILRGEVFLPNGQKKVLFKNDWNSFIDQMNEDIIAWRQYNRHVKDLTSKIVEKFHGKKAHCCEKCLEDHLIKNVVTAHDTIRALAEALNCAGYWQRCLDEIVNATSKLTDIQIEAEISSSDFETGWSYASSSEDNNSFYCYTKEQKMIPSPSWKALKETPCACPCQLKQLFPKY